MKQSLLVLLFVFLSACATGTPFDPNLAAHDAQYQAERYAVMATGTAEAQIVPITQTAAVQQAAATNTAQALAYQQQMWTITAQSVQSTQTAAMTQTAMSWTSTPNATSTAVFAALNAQSTQTALELKRQEQSNYFWAIVPGVTFALIAGALLIFLMLIMRRQRYQTAQVDERGNVLPMFDIVEGTATDPDNMPNYRGDLNETISKMFKEWLRRKLELPPLLPAVNVDRQDAVKQRDQLIDITVRGLPGGPRPENKKRAQEVVAQLPAPNLENRFKILDEGTPDLEVVDAEIIAVLDQDWKKAE